MSADNLLDLFDDNIPEEVLAWTTANSTLVTINADGEEESGWDDQEVTSPAPLLPASRRPLATPDQQLQSRVRSASPPSPAFVTSPCSLLDRICTESKPVEQKSGNTTTKRWKERARPPHLTEGSPGSRAYPHVMRPHKTIHDIVATSLIAPAHERPHLTASRKAVRAVAQNGVTDECKNYDLFTGGNAVDPSSKPAQSALTTEYSTPGLTDSSGWDEPSDDTEQESFTSFHQGSTVDVAADGWDSPADVSYNLPIGAAPVRKVAFEDNPVDADSSEETESLQTPNDYANDWGEPPYDIPAAPESGTILRLGAHWLDIEPPMGCSSWAIYFRRNPTNEDLHRPEDDSEEEEHKQEGERAKNWRRTTPALGARLEPHQGSHRSRPPTSTSPWSSESSCRHTPAIGSNSNTINLPFNRWEQNGPERVSQSGESQSDATAEGDDEKLTIVWPEDVDSAAWDEPAEHPLVPRVQRPLTPPLTTPQANVPLAEEEEEEEADGPSEVLQQMSKPEATSTKVHPLHQGFRVPTVPPVEGQILAQNFKSRIRPGPRISQLDVREEAQEVLSSAAHVSPPGKEEFADELTTADEPHQSRVKDTLTEAAPPKGKIGTDSGIDLHAITSELKPLSALSSVSSNSPRRLHTGAEPQQGHHEMKKVLSEEYFKNLDLLLDLKGGQHNSSGGGGSKGPEEVPLNNSVDGDVDLSLEVLIERSWAHRQKLLAVLDKE